jgi:AI-2 transport protein TqsA
MICAAVLTLAGLWAARAVMTPVAFALFIITLVWPLQQRLRAVLPQVIAVLITAAVALLAIGGGGWLVVWGCRRDRSVGDHQCPTAPGPVYARS